MSIILDALIEGYNPSASQCFNDIGKPIS